MEATDKYRKPESERSSLSILSGAFLKQELKHEEELKKNDPPCNYEMPAYCPAVMVI